ncbi:MAG: hypothetical protein KAW41_02285, partial [Candidatus Diapherotrites archaeon]|nr:hypothetical protein [Candidatus Diapherotrites archaeon]
PAAKPAAPQKPTAKGRAAPAPKAAAPPKAKPTPKPRPPSEFTPETKRRLRQFDKELAAAKAQLASLSGKKQDVLAKAIAEQEKNMAALDDAVRSNDKDKAGEVSFQLLFKKGEIKNLLK